MISKDVEIALSKDGYNRISSWLEALQKAYSNLMVREYFKENMEGINNQCNFHLNNKLHYTHASYAAMDALINYSVILTCHVFTTGDKGYGVASNRHDPEIDKFRESMINYVLSTNDWTIEEFESLKSALINNRNQLVAHYSGIAAEYKEPAPGIASRKMIGATVTIKDMSNLKSMIETMCEYIERNIYAR